MSSEYNFIRISEKNLKDFQKLGENAFGSKSSYEDVKKLFDTSDWGKDYIGYLAYSNKTNEVAAFYGVFPCFAEFDGKKYLVAQSGSTMTHTNHRKKGLFYSLAQKTFELAKEEGIDFIFGFPNEFSYRGFIKLNWIHDGNIQSYHIIVPTFPLGHLARKLRFLQPLYKAWFNFIIKFWRTDYHPFLNSSIEENNGGVCHDKAFINYKTENENRFMLRLKGRTVWVNQQQGSVGIGDIELIDDEKDFKKVIRALKLICFLSGSADLRTYVSSDSKLDKLFRKNGYKSREGLANCYFNLNSDLPLGNFKYVYADFDTF